MATTGKRVGVAVALATATSRPRTAPVGVLRPARRNHLTVIGNDALKPTSRRALDTLSTDARRGDADMLVRRAGLWTAARQALPVPV